MTPKWQQRVLIASQIGSVLSGIAALVAIALTWHLYALTRTQQSTEEFQAQLRRQSEAATSIYRSYVETSLEHPALFDPKNPQAPAYLMTTAESLFLATDDPAWRRTVARMLVDRRPLIEHTQWDCATFSADFVTFTRDAGLTLSCVT